MVNPQDPTVQLGAADVIRARYLPVYPNLSALYGVKGSRPGEMAWCGGFYIWNGITWLVGGGGAMVIHDNTFHNPDHVNVTDPSWIDLTDGGATVLHFHAGGDHSLLTNLGYATAGHTGFLGLATAQTITGEKLIDSAVPLRFGHAAGPTIQGPASGLTLTLTGDLAVTGHASVGGSIPSAYYTLSLTGILTTYPAGGIQNLITVQRSSGNLGAYGISGMIIAQGTPTASILYVLYFAATHNCSTICVSLSAMQVNCQSSSSGSGAITIARSVWLYANLWQSAKPTTAVGVDIEQQGGAGTATAYGIRIADQTATTVRLLELGPPATPYLRLLGGAAPAANQTHLYLAEGVTPTLRQVQWKLYSAMVAGDRVMVLV